MGCVDSVTLNAPYAMARDLLEEELTHSVIGAFYDAYNTLGYGFLEHVYELALERELKARGHQVDTQLAVTIMYKGEALTHQRMDMVVDHKLIVELKATDVLPAIATRQLFNYLRATNIEVGLLLHFGPKPAFYREICTMRRSAGSA
jgi:GxxExxY protein